MMADANITEAIIYMINSIGSAGSTLDIGRQGMQRSSESMQDSASKIASLATKPADSAGVGDVVEPLVNLRIQQNLFDASARVVQAGSDTLGALIDIKA